MVGNIADFHFTPTSQSFTNLRLERKPSNKIRLTGNTAIDALKWTVDKDYNHPLLDEIGDSCIVLVTSHRRENLGKPMENIFKAIRRLSEAHEDTQFAFPVHLNPKVHRLINKILGELDRVHLMDPLNVFDFHNFAAKSTLILTDSGGVQEEAPSLGVPVLVLRDTTERPEGVNAGTLKLVGIDEETIFSASNELLTNESERLRMANASNPYGDGKASKKIIEILDKEL